MRCHLSLSTFYSTRDPKLMLIYPILIFLSHTLPFFTALRGLAHPANCYCLYATFICRQPESLPLSKPPNRLPVMIQFPCRVHVTGSYSNLPIPKASEKGLRFTVTFLQNRSSNFVSTVPALHSPNVPANRTLEYKPLFFRQSVTVLHHSEVLALSVFLVTTAHPVSAYAPRPLLAFPRHVF